MRSFRFTSGGIRPMTEGSIARHLIAYSVPAILGDLFQLTYNTVDSIIVGKYAGAGALAAVGVASPLMSIAMFLIIGMGIGASVLMSEFYGAGDLKSLRREFSTTLLMSQGLSLAIAALLFLLARPLLRLVHTPADIFADTSLYLRIVAVGMLVTNLYNILAAASPGTSAQVDFLILPDAFDQHRNRLLCLPKDLKDAHERLHAVCQDEPELPVLPVVPSRSQLCIFLRNQLTGGFNAGSRGPDIPQRVRHRGQI